MRTEILQITDKLCRDLNQITWEAPVHTVYNPLEYAREPYEKYVRLFGAGTDRVLLVGMNPGPWGMAQTGIPFGEVRFVHDWMKISGRVEQPPKVHAKRPITGFECRRSEVSGSRLWGWAVKRYGSPESFFNNFFVMNYCPLIFFDQEGRNITPDKLPAWLRGKLFNICDEALLDQVREMEPSIVVGIGRFACKRAEIALERTAIKTGRIIHPSPANPAANKGWAAVVERELSEMGIELPGVRSQE